MDPISLGLGVVGLGMSLFGSLSQSSASSQYAQQSKQLSLGIAADEQKINQQKQNQMLLESRRMQLEQLRINQRQRSMATAAAVNQGAFMGSGLQGGLSQIQNESSSNLLGINQGVEIGTNIFGINNDISGKRSQLASLNADYQSQTAQNQGLQTLGSSLMKIGPTAGAFGKDLGAMNLGKYFMGGGSPSGYGN